MGTVDTMQPAAFCSYCHAFLANEESNVKQVKGKRETEKEVWDREQLSMVSPEN